MFHSRHLNDAIMRLMCIVGLCMRQKDAMISARFPSARTIASIVEAFAQLRLAQGPILDDAADLENATAKDLCKTGYWW